jgi:hypothetical protein
MAVTVMAIDAPLFGVLVGASRAVRLNDSDHAKPNQPSRQAKWRLTRLPNIKRLCTKIGYSAAILRKGR